MFAKPFVGDLGRGHVDGVYVMSKDPERLGVFASGSGDGVGKSYLSDGTLWRLWKVSLLTKGVSSKNLGLDQ